MQAQQAPPKLGDLISEILSVEGAAKFLNPLAEVTPEAERRAAYVKLVRATGRRYARCDFESYRIYHDDQRDVYQRIEQYAAEMPDNLRSGGGLVLFGNPGTGKDHLMVALLHWAILRHGLTVEWINGMELYAAMRDRITARASEIEFIKRFRRPTILAISDPQPPRGEVSNYGCEILYRIIDRRYRDLKPTFATMNAANGLDADSKLAANLIDRLRHNAVCLKCEWPTYREAAQ